MITGVYVTSLVGIGLVAAIFYFVIRNAKREDTDYQQITRKWYRIRGIWFLFLLTLGTAVTYLTLTPFPIPDQEKKYADGEYQTVNVDSHQWYWVISPGTVKAGQPVEFLVTASDVNHGFGIYDENLRLLTQTQAMPGYTNRIVYTFDKPGIFKILCLEYCGLAHHGMIGSLIVE